MRLGLRLLARFLRPTNCSQMFPIYSVFLFLFGFALGTERPIIGILTEEVDPNKYGGFSSYIAASYVKAIEQSGARVAPIFINRTDSYYREILNAVNGVLFPGGGVMFTDFGGYADAGRIILNYTKEVNHAGDHFPILGVCLGHELLFYLEVESYSILNYCNATNIALPLTFKNKFRNSRLYNQASNYIINILTNLPVTYNYHKRCVTEELLKTYNLTNKWHVLSTSIDMDGKEFISSVESHHYPIAGIQFHPEKNAFEWNPDSNITHTRKSVYSSRYFYDWLVNEGRRNNHSFKDVDTETAALIYNYNATYAGKAKAHFQQIYLFS